MTFNRIAITERMPMISAVMVVFIATLFSFQNLIYYVKPNLTLLVILSITPFVFQINVGSKRMRYAWFSAALLILYFLFKMQLLYFLAFGFLVLFVIESNLGMVNALPIFIILLISPYATFIFNVFGFPVRLFLTDIAADMLSLVSNNVSSEGNNIVIDNQYYAVDAECMGLTMVGYGYAMTLLFIRFFEKRFSNNLPLYKVIAVLIVSTGFIVFVNLLRIVVIILLKSPPETILHELIGLSSFGLYFLLPIYFFVKRMVVTHNKMSNRRKKSRSVNWRLVWMMNGILILSLGYLNHHREDYRHSIVDHKSSQITLNGFQKSIVDHHVVKLENDSSLIYIKPSCAFFAPDHSPTICWKGSGYAFENIQSRAVLGYPIFHAELSKKQDKLYTAWWFDNGIDKTNSQIQWRWKSALGSEPYRLVNVTATSKEALNKIVVEMLNKNMF